MNSFYENMKTKLAILADKIDWKLVTRYLIYFLGALGLFYLFFSAFGTYALDWRTFFYAMVLTIWSAVLG